MNKYTPVIGFETHVELKTVSKMFCSCKNDPFHADKPNIYTCPVCLGLPGALPVPNKKAVEWTIMLGLALGCRIPEVSKFDRKNYFYPDLPKGYQISQYDQPLCVEGLVKTELGDVRITRVHLEEDTGKLQHTTLNNKKVTLIDFNRSGVPLVEIVTEPDIKDGEHSKVFLKKLHQIIRYLGISDADMEKGSMRLEPNISLRKTGETKLPGYKVEVKNINSFNFAKRAIEYEVARQTQSLEMGETPKQETRGWEESQNVTLPQRSKEGSADYRYFPEPDIPPMRFAKDFVKSLKDNLPELPNDRKARLVKQYSLPESDASRLVEQKDLADFFEKCVMTVDQLKETKITYKAVANWLLNKPFDIKKNSPNELIKLLAAKSIVTKLADNELNTLIQKVIATNGSVVASYKAGKTGVIMFLVGQAMKELKGKGDALSIRKALEKKLAE